MSKSVYVWRQTLRPRRGGNQCSVSLPVFFLIPQDESVSAPTPSLLLLSSVCLVCCFSLKLWSHSHSAVLLTHFVALHLHPPPISPFLFLPASSFLPLLCLSLRTVVFTLRLLVLFSSSGGWRRVLPSWLPRGCCGNNSCHCVVQTWQRRTRTELKKKHELFKPLSHSLCVITPAWVCVYEQTWTREHRRASLHSLLFPQCLREQQSRCLLANRAAQRLCWSHPRCLCVCMRESAATALWPVL